MENLVAQGFELALFGMGTVFVFLTLLIFATRLMSALVLAGSGTSNELSSNSGNSDLADNGELIAVISAAVNQHRKNH